MKTSKSLKTTSSLALALACALAYALAYALARLRHSSQLHAWRVRWRVRSRVRVACALALASFAEVVPSPAANSHCEPCFRHRRTDGRTLAVRDFLIERGRMGGHRNARGQQAAHGLQGCAPPDRDLHN